jgi:hypothetical protein
VNIEDAALERLLTTYDLIDGTIQSSLEYDHRLYAHIVAGE